MAHVEKLGALDSWQTAINMYMYTLIGVEKRC